ncbi:MULTISPECIES: lipopolysaccharide assembly protein LapB [unclassified Lactobacillus]|uniref:tetratricopeptide repeat protein n=1 Tax=unclassified Lactobacillus TaxID=2620435 RepID=UPI000EFC4BDF|nr:MULTISPECIES: tetratricopeptide repeat protein [unclassified Lactobacillus]RMC25121.1 tetratricopeptide repeat protein [Lactobacillus sp. ESL0247]RMC29276.1 tetratricopeptide repeat protein [Lactobacillus sp. ESL0246]RMC32296.1 tetratricopeptide repeat protein [Lactobacillus sp. ESL0245]
MKSNKFPKKDDNKMIKKRIDNLISEIDNHPQESENYLKLATILIEEGSFDQATQLLEQAKNAVKNPQDLDYDLAVCYYMQGKYDQALKLLDHIPNDDLVLYQKSLVLMKMGQLQKALAYALTISETDDRVLELLGDIWLGLGEFDQAEKSYTTISQDQRSAKVNFMLGITILTKNRDLAEKYFTISQKQDIKYFEQAQKKYDALLKIIGDKDKFNG